MNKTAIAIAHPNIAFIKYWGNRDPDLRLPENGSISMNLAELFTRTQVSFHLKNKKDQLSINSRVASENELERVVKFLNHVRHISEKKLYAKVVSENNFPTAVGIASSASAFAALSLAATQAIGLQLSEAEQSRLARLGSGSACRSIPSGFVEWYPGQNDRDSFARSFAPPEHWEGYSGSSSVSVIHPVPKTILGEELLDRKLSYPAVPTLSIRRNLFRLCRY